MLRSMLVVVVAFVALAWPSEGVAQQPGDSLTDLDARVNRFLSQHRGGWHDLNVPEADGRALHDIIRKQGYKRALEIGTSTGYSGIWIAWALAHTGGKLITIEIDGDRYRQALKNFQDAGLSGYIDARLGDGHEIVPRLEGPFDFVFIDADKEWYTNYAREVIPMLTVGGALTAHNVSQGGRRSSGSYYQYMKGLSFFDTTVVNGGLAISYKRAEK